MKPFEFMVSESPGAHARGRDAREARRGAGASATKWGLRSTVIGTVTDTGRFVVREGDEVVADMPAATLAHDAPDLRPGDDAPRLPRRGAGVRPA